MKRKHHGLFSMIIITLAVLLMVGYGFYLLGNVKSTVSVTRPRPIAQDDMPDDKKFKKMKKLKKGLFSIARMSDDTKTVSMRMFGWKPVIEKQDSIDTSDWKLDYEDLVDFSYDLTLCFSSKQNSFCVIDDVLYRKGNLLPDEGEIIKIEHDRVQIKKNNVKEWIYMSGKYSRTREKEKTMSSKEKT